MYYYYILQHKPYKASFTLRSQKMFGMAAQKMYIDKLLWIFAHWFSIKQSSVPAPAYYVYTDHFCNIWY